MRRLYAFALSPWCRKVRLTLAEKGLEADLVETRPWEAGPDLLRLNPAGEVPVLVEPSGLALSGSTAICEYLEECYPEVPLLPGDAAQRAEIRRIVGWFDVKFRLEVTENLLTERVLRRLRRQGEPDSVWVRHGLVALRDHLGYVADLSTCRHWLAGEALSLADFTAAAHLSALDYTGSVPWSDFPAAHDWYARLKSRPAFRTLLADHVPGIPPAQHYADPDF